MITFRCHCGKAYNVKDDFAGRQAKCQVCGQGMTAPGAGATQALPLPEQDATSGFADSTKEKGDGVTQSLEVSEKKSANQGETARPSSTMGERSPKPVGGHGYGIHRIVRTHARGGMGQVCIAQDENLKREVALKELFENTAGDKESVRRFFLRQSIKRCIC